MLYWLRAEDSGPVVDWLSEKFGHAIPPTWCAVWLVKGEIRGAVAFEDYRPQYGTVELTCFLCATGMLPPRYWRAVLADCFDRLECQAVIMRTDNPRMRDIAQRMGCTITYLPRVRGRNRGEWFCLLADDVWRAKDEGSKRSATA